MKINKYTSSHNCGSRYGTKLEYLVIHYTGSTHSEKGTALACCKMFATSPRPASADFVVDDEEIYQYNPNIAKYRCYSVGGSKYKYMSTKLGGEYYGKCNNKNSISIEMKSSKVNKKSVKDEDTDWYITEKVINNTAKLASYLLKKYNIPFNHMIMHHQVTGKLCPLPFCQKSKDLSKWEDFKKLVKKYMNNENTNKTTPTVKSNTTTKVTTKVNSNLATINPIKGENDKDRFIRTFKGQMNIAYKTKFKNTATYDSEFKNFLKSHNITKKSPKPLVRHLQWWLKHEGYKGLNNKELAVDGDFGDNTAKALSDLQKKLGLKPDGSFGTGTMDKFIKTL